MRSRRVIDATNLESCITSTRGGIEIRGTKVPLEEVAVLMLGNRASVSGGALSMLAKYDVIVLNTDWRGIPNLVAYPWIDNSRVAARHRAQAELSLPRRKQSWQSIVRAKILGQAFNLQETGGAAHGRLKTLAKSVRSGDVENVEAQAAKIYWEQLFDDPRFTRQTHSDEHINAMLNYGYAILRGFVIQGLTIAGLWPTLGIWHRNRSNTFCLADDLIEPFRPAVDAAVWQLQHSDGLDDREVKRKLVSIVSAPMQDSGTTVATAVYEAAQDLALFIEGKKRVFEVPAWSTPFNHDHG